MDSLATRFPTLYSASRAIQPYCCTGGGGIPPGKTNRKRGIMKHHLESMVHEMAVAAADFDLGEDPVFECFRHKRASSGSQGPDPAPPVLAGADRSPSVSDLIFPFKLEETDSSSNKSLLSFGPPHDFADGDLAPPPPPPGFSSRPSFLYDGPAWIPLRDAAYDSLVADAAAVSRLRPFIEVPSRRDPPTVLSSPVTPIKRAREPRLSTAGSSPQQAISIPSDSPPPPKKRKTDDSKEGKKREKGKGRAGAGPSGEVPETPVKTVGVTPHEGMRKRAMYLFRPDDKFHPAGITPPDILLPYPNNFKKRLVDQDGNELPNGHWAYGAERNLTDENPATIREDGATKMYREGPLTDAAPFFKTLTKPAVQNPESRHRFACATCAGRGIDCTGGDLLGGTRCDQCAATKAACCGYQFTAPRPARDGSLSLIDELAPRRVQTLARLIMQELGSARVLYALYEDAEERALAYAKDLSNRFRRNVNSSWHNHLRQLVGDAVDLDALTEIIAFAEADPLTQVEFHPRTQNALLTRVTDESITIDARARVGTASPSQDVLEHDLPPAPPAPRQFNPRSARITLNHQTARQEKREKQAAKGKGKEKEKVRESVVERIYVGGDLSSDDEEKEEEEEEAAPASADEEGDTEVESENGESGEREVVG
ncbi:hypothetical protein DFP72DRAFT_843330 [Ephemerocybe angulata]|uniref:Uncharacterized protein n=1 Tax=Ephemerocybe angulata TaxID=980116 RepID=A0A8H6I7N0_9AGAR|nr:hypothetical protein DFP72DRAFT_843330 [Tulosesus angulatus]